MLRVIFWAVLPLLLFGCATRAKRPVLSGTLDAQSREALYQQYRLSEDRGFLSRTWKRADGEYSWDELEQVARQFPETRAIHDRATTRGLVLGAIGGTGGAIVGYTFGYNLVAADSKRMSSDAQIALYATGGGIVLVGLLIDLAWSNPVDEFTEAYNRALRKRLRLKTRTDRAVLRPSWIPALMPDGVAWRF